MALLRIRRETYAIHPFMSPMQIFAAEISQGLLESGMPWVVGPSNTPQLAQNIPEGLSACGKMGKGKWSARRKIKARMWGGRCTGPPVEGGCTCCRVGTASVASIFFFEDQRVPGLRHSSLKGASQKPARWSDSGGIPCPSRHLTCSCIRG